MRVPEHFRPRAPQEAWEVVDRHGFGTLVTADGGAAPVGSPLPFLGRPADGDGGSLIGHMALANPQLASLRRLDARVLVVFAGPSAFVSASYYDEEPAVPTWNHVTVQVTGRPRLLTGEAATLEVLEQTVAHFERQVGSKWRLNVDDPYVRELARQVAAFAVDVDRIKAVFKLSQNLEPELQRRAAAGLLAAGHTELVAAMGHQAGLSLGSMTTGVPGRGCDARMGNVIRLLSTPR